MAPVAGRDPKKLVIGVLAAIVAIVLGGVVAYYVKSTHELATRNAEAISSARSSAAAAAAEAARKQVADDEKRSERKSAVDRIEQSVRSLAEQQMQDGLFDGPILKVSCDPVGGSTDDLSEQTTIFECFVANEDNGDGTLSGEKYHARMNWETEELTYGYGAPR
ncbi:DUF2510 domain-containing protein [[Mycobacterium] holstebronense]|uniref:DUF2510 domain-containing protein n=1 Tax=[Mycobacterium] holstebronense TaxID=3064288 RepID=A0ABM9LX36_9MYCO|nr:DUF2510 domain-containing protein [Mycolicibacter sp. MU0102]CAJ1506181.1 DUF2510 domain-containing protein [Mycolicibacter sp. MU0102]